MTQEHIPGPRDRFICEVRSAIESDTKSGVSARRIVTAIKDSLAALVISQEAPVPLLEDGELVVEYARAISAFVTSNPNRENDLLGKVDSARTTLLSRLSSLRESVASLTAERDAALDNAAVYSGQLLMQREISNTLKARVKDAEGERAAMRAALEAARHELTTLHGLTATDDPHAYSDALAEGLDANAASECEAEASFKINMSKTLAVVDALLTPNPTKDGSHG